MDLAGAVQEIKKDLESTFGNTLTTSIIAMARTKGNVPLIGMTKQNYFTLIELIGTDNRVQSMLGGASAKELLAKWKKLVE